MENIKLFLMIVEIFFVIYLLSYSTFLFLSVAYGTSELYEKNILKKMHNELKHDYYIPISIVTPAYNEELTVVDTVKSLLACEYKLMEVIVVDDGSTDQTAAVLIDYFKLKKIDRPLQRKIKCKPEKAIYQNYVDKKLVTLIMKENGGKADSLNMGINASLYPYFICIDADSVLQKDALEQIIQPVIYEPNVIASGGLIKISNGVTFKNGEIASYRLPKNILAALQVMEYDRSFLAARIFLDSFNANLIISGAFGLFKKDVVIQAGGYDPNTMGEDMELVVKLHSYAKTSKIDYVIKYEPDAICWTQAPTKLRDLYKQRKRWHIGLIQTMQKYKTLISDIDQNPNSIFSFLYFLFYEMLSPIIEIAGIAVMIFSFYVDLIYIDYMILLFIIYLLFGAILTLTTFFSRIYTQKIKLSVWDSIKAVFLCLFESLVFHQFILIARLSAFLSFKKSKKTWGKISRQKHDIEEEKEENDE